MAFKMDDSYNTVAERIVEFREKHPDGCLQQVKYELLEVPVYGRVKVAVGDTEVEEVQKTGVRVYIAFTAAAYRSPDDKLPGIGTAWEPIPGPTSFTRDSEMQNAETAAWGRALVAVLAADTKKGIATHDEVANRRGEW
jgi:hypothetical protein